MIRKIVFLIFLSVFSITSFSQKNSISFDYQLNNYFVDTSEYKQIDFIYTNPTDDIFILWLDDLNNDSLSISEKTRNFFRTRRGDFTLNSMIYEDLRTEIPITLYSTFFKIIKPNEQFIMSVLITDHFEYNDILNRIKKQIVIVKFKEADRIPSLDQVEEVGFKGKTISILGESIR